MIDRNEFDSSRYIHRLMPFDGKISIETAMGDVGIWDKIEQRFLEEKEAVLVSRARAIEAAINRFRDCGVEIERFSLKERLNPMSTTLCVDGVPRFRWTFHQ